MKWFEELYVQRRDWLLSNFERLPLTSEELNLFLLLDLLKEKRVTTTYEKLAKSLKMSEVAIDQMITSLSKRKLLVIHLGKKGASFDISPIFSWQEQVENNETNESEFISLFEQTFGRPLSMSELAKLSDLLKTYRHQDLFQALRTSDAYQKYSLAYIETILRNDESKR